MFQFVFLSIHLSLNCLALKMRRAAQDSLFLLTEPYEARAVGRSASSVAVRDSSSVTSETFHSGPCHHQNLVYMSVCLFSQSYRLFVLWSPGIVLAMFPWRQVSDVPRQFGVRWNATEWWADSHTDSCVYNAGCWQCSQADRCQMRLTSLWWCLALIRVNITSISDHHHHNRAATRHLSPHLIVSPLIHTTPGALEITSSGLPSLLLNQLRLEIIERKPHY